MQSSSKQLVVFRNKRTKVQSGRRHGRPLLVTRTPPSLTLVEKFIIAAKKVLIFFCAVDLIDKWANLFNELICADMVRYCRIEIDYFWIQPGRDSGTKAEIIGQEPSTLQSRRSSPYCKVSPCAPMPLFPYHMEAQETLSRRVSPTCNITGPDLVNGGHLSEFAIGWFNLVNGVLKMLSALGCLC